MKISRERLLKQLESVSVGLAKVEELEQSGHFVFRDGKVFTFNDEIAAATNCDLELTGAIAAKPMLTLLQKLSEEELNVEVVENELKIKGKRKRAGLTISEIRLPLDVLDDPSAYEPIPIPEKFFEAINLVSGCACKDQDYFFLTCVHVHPEWIEASDSYQIARYKLSSGFSKSVLIRQSTIKQITKLDSKSYWLSDGWLHFYCDEGLMVSVRTHSGNYTDLSDLFKFTGTKTILPDGMGKILDKAKVFASDNLDNEVLVKLTQGLIEIKGQNDSGWYAEQQKIEYDGEPVSFGVSCNLLSEIAKRNDKCSIGEGKLKVQTKDWVYSVCTWVD